MDTHKGSETLTVIVPTVKRKTYSYSWTVQTISSSSHFIVLTRSWNRLYTHNIIFKLVYTLQYWMKKQFLFYWLITDAITLKIQRVVFVIYVDNTIVYINKAKDLFNFQTFNINIVQEAKEVEGKEYFSRIWFFSSIAEWYQNKMDNTFKN